MVFKEEVAKILKENNYDIDEQILSDDKDTFGDIVDYYVKLTDSEYDQELINEIQMHKFHNLDIKFVFEKRLNNIKKQRNFYK